MTHEEAADKELELIQAAVTAAMNGAKERQAIKEPFQIMAYAGIGDRLPFRVSKGIYTVTAKGQVTQVATGYELEIQ